MYNQQGDTWFDEIRLPIRNIEYEYKENINSPRLDEPWVNEMGTDSYVKMKVYDETKQLQEKGTIGNINEKVNRCKECCKLENCIPCFVCSLFLVFILIIIIIYNVTDFDTAVKSCKQNLDKPVQAVVIYRNQSIAIFGYEFRYNKQYIFNVTCDIIVNNSPYFPVGTNKKIYISRSREECSFKEHWCEDLKINNPTAFMLSILGACIVCPFLFPCLLCCIKQCDNNIH